MKLGLIEDMHRIDKEAAETYSLPEIVLMENAGRRSAELVMEMLGTVQGKSLCVIAGSGNNGGDAMSAARHLANKGARVRVFLAGEHAHLKPSAASMYAILERMGMELHELNSDRDWDRLHMALKFSDGVVDGILGTGAVGELRKKTLRLIEEINQSERPVMSIDMPSGVAADNGAVQTMAVKACSEAAPDIHVFEGMVVSGDQFINSLEKRDEILSLLPDVQCVEMEGAAVAQVCLEFGTPFTVIRTISDTADHNARVDFGKFIVEVANAYSRAIIQEILRLL